VLGRGVNGVHGLILEGEAATGQLYKEDIYYFSEGLYIYKGDDYIPHLVGCNKFVALPLVAGYHWPVHSH